MFVFVIVFVFVFAEGGTRNRARTLANDTPLPSMGMEATGVPMTGKIGRYQSTDSGVSSEHHKQRSVVLEHLLHSTHIHGDGENRYAYYIIICCACDS